MKKKLVILTTHFGTNFSGGSTATCEIFSRIEDHFSGLIVIGTELGEHPFKNLEFQQYDKWREALKLLKNLDRKDKMFYGDFYNSYLYILAKVPFFFTYHDNWPELGKTGVRNFFKSMFYTSIYKQVFKKAQIVFTVSSFKKTFIERFTKSVYLVRNGFTPQANLQLLKSKPGKLNVIMVGNIDSRKYEKAIALFSLIRDCDFQIDIYGHCNDKKLVEQLEQYSFVNIKGFHNEIPYGNYQLLLHTSLMENLSIVFCEAIYHKIPILAFDVGGAKEIVGSQNGVLIPPYNLNEMKKTLLDMLSETLVFNVDNSVLEEFSWDKASEKYLNSLVEYQNIQKMIKYSQN